MLSNEKLYPVTLGVYMWSSQVPEDPNFTILAITGAAVSIIPLVALFHFLQRYWRSGMTAGAVK
ncbi:hypothetical protein NGB36_31655 [Streptomyces sp. RB6PN25]|uniref:Uncharacterized protein n=1 Tax=Streptomyces humicola TaxID=2953240 RepID=A0ABT1Q4Y3_9ACTN|nr:hypothetical protein [Streptomyces humicola]MCQ4084996.1 hypothetical protein [Streptomyces humicola]